MPEEHATQEFDWQYCHCPAFCQPGSRRFEFSIQKETNDNLILDLLHWQNYVAAEEHPTLQQRRTLKRLKATVQSTFQDDVRVIRSSRGLEGFISLAPFRPGDEFLEVFEFGAAPWNDYYSKCRVPHIGLMLVKSVVEEAKKLPGVHGIHAIVINRISARVFRKAGFKRIHGNLFCCNLNDCSHLNRYLPRPKNSR
jgi:hypothetical protein